MGPGQASTSRHAELNGSGALSHVYIQYPPFRCTIPGAMGVMYDDGNKLLLVPSVNKVFSWSVNRYPHTDNPSITSINEGPVLAIRYSLDGKILAVQRTNNELEFINRETGTVFQQQCKHRTERILGFFWTDCPICDLVFVTASGLELYIFQPGMDCLKLIETKRFNVSWYIYTHESRLVLLASGMQCKTLSGYQFSAGGVIRLPKFEATMTKAEVNRKPVLAPEDVRIATMYGRIYCLQVDRVAMQLNLYRFYRDAVMPQGSLPVYSANAAISVVDNVLLVHQIESKVVLLYDILSDYKTPISAPLPLLLRGFPIPVDLPNEKCSSADHWEALTPPEANTYSDGWVFVNPDIILDHAHGLLWRIHLDLEAIVASSSDIPSLLAFLQRRRHEAGKAKQLSIAVLRSAIIERRPISLISDAMNVVTVAYSHAVKPSSSMAYKQPAIYPQRPSSENTQHKSNAPDHFGSSTVEGAENHANILPINCQYDQQKNKAAHDERVAEGSSSNDAQSSADTADQDFQDNLSATDTSLKLEDMTGSPVSDSRSRVLPVEKEGTRNGAIFQHERPSESEKGHDRACIAQVLDPLGSRGVIAAISPDEMHEHVFATIEKEMATDSTLLVATIIEYMRSTVAEKLKVYPGTPALVVDLLVKDERIAELQQLISRKVLEPSREMALQLVQFGNHEPWIYILGLHMLKQVGAHTEYVSLLLQGGRLLEALRYVRQNKVETISPSTFLEAAAAVQDTCKLACVLRFCLDFVPNFQQTSDFRFYFSVLKQRNINITV